MISTRARSVDVSGIRKVFALAGSLRNPIDLSIGQPDFAAFEALRDYAKEAIDSGANKYLPTQGLPQLRSAIAKQYDLSDEFDVCITSGVTGGLALSYLCLLDPGDQVLIPDPYFVVYKELSTLFGIEAICYDTYPDFSATAQRIEAAITPKTKAVIVNSPANPTGVTISQLELEAISEVCETAGVSLIYDEIYDAFCFDNEHARLPLKPHTVVLNGFSKTYGIPGWRVGFVVAPKALIQAMSTVQQYTYVCANSVAQQALSQMPPVDFTDLLASYRVRRDFICEALATEYQFVRSSGAFYLFPEVPKNFPDASKFLEACLAEELLIVPGNAFSTKNSHFRISFSAPLSELERGVEVLLKLARAR